MLRQSTRADAYRAALRATSRRRGWLLPCLCSRAQLAALPANQRTCSGRRAVPSARMPAAGGPTGSALPRWRFRAPDRDVEFVDRVQGPQIANVARAVGDFVLRRRDGLYRLPARGGRRRRRAGHHRRGAGRGPARQHGPPDPAAGGAGAAAADIHASTTCRGRVGALSSRSRTARPPCRCMRRPRRRSSRRWNSCGRRRPRGSGAPRSSEVWEWAIATLAAVAAVPECGARGTGRSIAQGDTWRIVG